jgi:Leucine-rich repeat (LRR) protein
LFFFFVSTAAHCIFDKGQPEALEAEDVIAMLGKHYLNIFNETGSVNSSVHEIFIHPDWSNSKFSFHADIAILVLTDLISFSNLIQPICLPEQSFDDVETGVGVIAGWGQSQRNHLHDVKPNALEIPVINSTHCLLRFPKLVDIASVSSFCGGYENQGKAPCLGDSGGGLFFQKSYNLKWIARGIVSSSLLDNNRQCDINAFQFYTNVARFVDWIEKVVESTMEIEWEFVEFDCEIQGWENVCSHRRPGLWHKYMKFSTNFKEIQNITVIYLTIFPFDRIISGIGEVCINLQKLFVDEQSLTILKPESFANMEKLHTLSFLKTFIKKINANAFESLVNLKLLNMRMCGLSYLPLKLFYHQQKLKYLDLGGNRLTYLAKDIFANNLELKRISLDRNILKQIYVDFTEFTKVDQIRLEHNVCINLEFKNNSTENFLKNFTDIFTTSIQNLQENINQNCLKDEKEPDEIWIKFQW